MGASLIPSIPFTRVQSDTSGNIALALNSRAVMFISSANIAAPATVTIGGGLNNFSEFKWRFNISNVAGVITFPANIKSSDPLFVANVWTPLNTGEYECSGAYDGTNWNLTIIGPYT